MKKLSVGLVPVTLGLPDFTWFQALEPVTTSPHKAMNSKRVLLLHIDNLITMNLDSLL